jgi:hypothetical protein
MPCHTCFQESFGTPLHYAIHQGSADIVIALIAAGANITEEDVSVAIGRELTKLLCNRRIHLHHLCVAEYADCGVDSTSTFTYRLRHPQLLPHTLNCGNVVIARKKSAF